MRRGVRPVTAYPMLAMFRSRQPGQNWLTALGVVLDAATICLAAVDSPGSGRRRGCGGGPPGRSRASGGCPRPCVGRPRTDGAATEEAPFREAYERLRGLGCRCTLQAKAWAGSAGCGGLCPRAADGDQAAAGAAGVPAPDGPAGHHPLRLTSGSPASSARRYQAARASR